MYKYPKILLTGGSGQLGQELKSALLPLGEVWAPNSLDFDLKRPDSLRLKIRDFEPSIIINLAAYTFVEQAELEPELAQIINVESPKVLAEESKKLDIPLIYLSTVFVFDGKKSEPYKETDLTNPVNIYGATKCQGEVEIQNIHEKHLIFRTSWLYSTNYGENFYRTMLKLFQEKLEVKVIDDQVGNPTSVKFLANAIVEILSNLKKNKETRWGLYHLAGNESMSWFEFAKKIYTSEGGQDFFKTKRILPISSEEFTSRVNKPNYSVLNCDKVQHQFGDIYTKNFFDKKDGKTTKPIYLLYFTVLKLLTPLFILFFPSYISTFLDFGRQNHRLPKRNERITKKDNVLDEFDFFNFDTPQFEEVNVVMRGSLEKISNPNLPTFFVNSFKTIPAKFTNIFSVTGDRLIFEAMMGEPVNDFYRRFHQNYKKLNVMPLVKLVNKLKESNFYTENEPKHFREMIEKYKQDIGFNGEYNSVLLAHPFKGQNVQIGSGILCALAMLKLSEKVNIYGWDAFIDDEFPTSFWSQTMKLWSNFDDFHPGSRFAAIVLNWIYAYRLINEFDSNRLTVNGRVNEVSKLRWVEKYLFKVVYK
jgi:dTDP-4-dehydrorhamnose reductase